MDQDQALLLVARADAGTLIRALMKTRTRLPNKDGSNAIMLHLMTVWKHKQALSSLESQAELIQLLIAAQDPRADHNDHGPDCASDCTPDYGSDHTTGSISSSGSISTNTSISITAPLQETPKNSTANALHKLWPTARTGTLADACYWDAADYYSDMASPRKQKKKHKKSKPSKETTTLHIPLLQPPPNITKKPKQEDTQHGVYDSMD